MICCRSLLTSPQSAQEDVMLRRACAAPIVRPSPPISPIRMGTFYYPKTLRQSKCARADGYAQWDATSRCLFARSAGMFWFRFLLGGDRGNLRAHFGRFLPDSNSLSSATRADYQRQLPSTSVRDESAWPSCLRRSEHGRRTRYNTHCIGKRTRRTGLCRTLLPS